jgi:hypothetical protein
MKIISLEEIEYAISVRFGIRKNIIVPNISWGLFIHECDLLIVRPSGHAIEVEIKRSISDLKKDFDKGHGHKDKRIKQFYYAIPDVLYDKAKVLIPKDCGIIVINKHKDYNVNIADIVREAKINKDSLPLTDKEIFKVAKLGTMRIWNLKYKLINFKNKL